MLTAGGLKEDGETLVVIQMGTYAGKKDVNRTEKN